MQLVFMPQWSRYQGSGLVMLCFPQDMAELEEAVGAHLAPPASLGRPSRALRALRSLLFAGRCPNPHSLKPSDLLR